MAEIKYESKITSAPASADTMFAVLSDLSNIERVKDLIPQDKVRDMEFDRDTVRFKVDGLGQKIMLRILEREPGKTVKFGADNSPIPLNFWIQLKQVADRDTRIRLTVKTDLPVMFRMMLGSKLQQGLDQAADMLAQMPYDQWAATL
ncbi:MAG: SRPBCC family protein [Paludibacteraceae bacterium]|nr:SRPBCC family protein [Paludibacteraceae bacterium]MBQ9705224.1 SRPBCC family protein [Paludibacteraceae bacterium]